MNLFQRYKKLNFWNKLAFWGSLASILALLSIFAKGEKKGNVNIVDSPNSTVQNMVDSPKSVQAGRDVNIENFNVNIENNTTFIPPSTEIKEAIKNSLTMLKNKHSSGFPKILIVVEKTNEARGKVASTLDRILRNIGMGYLYKWRNVTFKKQPPPITITYTQENKSYAEEIIASLSYYIKGSYTHKPSKNYSIEQIEISLYGTPYFEKDGRVIIK